MTANDRVWRSGTRYRRASGTVIAISFAIVGLAIVGGVVDREPDVILPAILFAILGGAALFDVMTASVTLSDVELVVRDGRSKRVTRERIKEIRADRRGVSILGVDQLPFVVINRSKFDDRQLEQIAAALGVPIFGRRRPRRNGRFEDSIA